MNTSINNKNLADLKKEIQIKAKNGIDFITAASLLWGLIAVIWSLDFPAYTKSIFTFMISGIMLPLAFGFSKLFSTTWKIPGNPLQPLGMWLNIAQLFYFPILIFILLRYPEYFIMTFSIITGAHFLPYAWFYDEYAYAIAAAIIPIGSFSLALTIGLEQIWFIPLFTACTLWLLGISIFIRWKKFSATVSTIN